MPSILPELVLGVELRPREVDQAEEGLEHPLPVHGARAEHRLAAAAARGRSSPRPIATRSAFALVELDDQRQLLHAQVQLFEVLAEVEERGGVVLGLADLRIGHERDPVGPLEHELARRGVQHLARAR